MLPFVRPALFLTALALLTPFCANAASADTDGDGFPDALEIVLGTDPSLSASTPTGSPANVQPFDAAVFVNLNFAGSDGLSISLDVKSSIDPATLAGTRSAFLIGGLARAVDLDAQGTGTSPNEETQGSFFTEGSDSFFILNTFSEFETEFVDEGLTSSVTGTKGVSVEAYLYFNGVLYSNSKLNGAYMVTAVPDAGSIGQAFFNTNEGNSAEGGFDIVLSDVSVDPAPAKAGEQITVDLQLKAKGIKVDDLTGVVDFGDGSAPTQLDSTNIEAVTHTYAANGVYEIQILILGSLDGQSVSIGATAFAVVGDDAAVNPSNGLVTEATVTPGDGATMANAQFELSSLEDESVTDATTEFEELDGLNPQPNQGASRDVVDGLLPSRAITKPSLTVAKSTAKTAAGQTRGTSRKTVAVGSRETNPTNSANVKPPKNNPGVVTVSKVSGKFIFTTDPSKNKPDQVTFSGTITLPEGFATSNPDGIRFAIGLGNVLDGLMLDAKGKPLNKATGDKTRLKKVSVKFPKLSGAALGTEVAKISVTMSTEDMDLKGFESEGITNRVRDDEAGRKAVDRMMQVNLMLAGEPYEAYIPIEFKLAPKGDAGSMATRRAK